MMDLKKLSKRYDQLPKWVKVIPYVAASGAATALIKYLKDLQLSEPILMGLIIVLLKGLKGLADQKIKKRHGK